jgi:hypothetical protein
MSVYRVGGNKSSQNVFPSVRPTLDLDFANSKTLDPRITFTRASGGSYVGADGLIKYAGVNEARFDHDPSTGESLGLLVEEARTNLFTRSEEFDIWNKFNVSVLLNSGSSPDGNFNAIQIIEDATTSSHYVIRTTGTITSGLPYTASCFAKSTNPNRFFSLIFEGAALLFEGVNPRASFDLTSGKINTITAATSAKIENYGNGWYRCSVTATPSATGSSAIQLRLQTNVTANVMIGPYTGDGVSGLYLWGAQLEQGAFPTSYIPTQASTRTRAADDAIISGSNVESWYRQDEGTFISDSRILKSSIQTQTVWSIGDGTNQISLRSPQGTGDRFRGNIGNTFTPPPGTGDTLLNTFKAAISYTSTVGRLQVGTASTEVTPSQLPINANVFGIGNLQGVGFSTRLNGTISRLTYFPKRLPNEQLIALTR